MIRQIPENEFVEEFLSDYADLGCGRHLDPAKRQHVEWVRKHIAVQCPRGGRFYAHFRDDGTITGIAAVLLDPGLDGDNCFGHMAEPLDVVVREQHRGNGYGRVLLEHVESESRAAGHG